MFQATYFDLVALVHLNLRTFMLQAPNLSNTKETYNAVTRSFNFLPAEMVIHVQTLYRSQLLCCSSISWSSK